MCFLNKKSVFILVLYTQSCEPNYMLFLQDLCKITVKYEKNYGRSIRYNTDKIPMYCMSRGKLPVNPVKVIKSYYSVIVLFGRIYKYPNTCTHL